jgi:hypothetical protein
MGFARRVVRKSVRKATPRSVRRAMHPARTVKNAVTPRPVKQASRAAYVVTHPIGAAENKVIGAVLGGGGRRTAGAGHSFSSGAHQPAGASGAVGGGIRANEAAAALEQMNRLMAVGRQRFADARPPLIPEATAVDPKPFVEREWKRRKGEASWWQRGRRRQIRTEARAYGERQAGKAFAQARHDQQVRQETANAAWSALCRGERSAVMTAIKDIFHGTPTPAIVLGVGGNEAAVAVLLPGPHVLPEKMPHVTPTGRLSIKAWPKTELNQMYAALLGAYLLSTCRGAWAAAPSLSKLRIIGMREETNARREVLFDVDVFRAVGAWDNDEWGTSVLDQAPHGLNRVGQSREVRAWAKGDVAADVLPLLTPAKRHGAP